MSSDAAKNAYPGEQGAGDVAAWSIQIQREAYDRGAREKAAEAWNEAWAAYDAHCEEWVRADMDHKPVKPSNPYREAGS